MLFDFDLDPRLGDEEHWDQPRNRRTHKTHWKDFEAIEKAVAEALRQTPPKVRENA